MSNNRRLDWWSDDRQYYFIWGQSVTACRSPFNNKMHWLPVTLQLRYLLPWILVRLESPPLTQRKKNQHPLHYFVSLPHKHRFRNPSLIPTKIHELTIRHSKYRDQGSGCGTSPTIIFHPSTSRHFQKTSRRITTLVVFDPTPVCQLILMIKNRDQTPKD